MSDVDDAIGRAEKEPEWNLATSGVDVARQAWRDRAVLAAEVLRLRAELADCRKGFVKAKPEWSQ